MHRSCRTISGGMDGNRALSLEYFGGMFSRSSPPDRERQIPQEMRNLAWRSLQHPRVNDLQKSIIIGYHPKLPSSAGWPLYTRDTAGAGAAGVVCKCL